MATLAGRQSGHAMDRIYRHQRHIYDLTRKYYLLGRDRLIRDLVPKSRHSVLEIGCGTARNLIEVARRYPDARCFGVDISCAMLATAEASIARADLGERIRITRGDAANFDGAALLGEPMFDRIVISYSLSMIPSWRAALERSVRALAPGGRLLLVDFGDLAGWPRLVPSGASALACPVSGDTASGSRRGRNRTRQHARLQGRHEKSLPRLRATPDHRTPQQFSLTMIRPVP